MPRPCGAALAASIKLRIVNTADSAASNSCGESLSKSKAIESSVKALGRDYAKFTTMARYTRGS
jgi:hypothetical protein